MKFRRTMRFLGIVAGTAIALAQTAVATASGQEHFVANDGMDSTTCGASDHPCRSISQAVKNAARGDTVWVRAGMYGDLNNDGKFDAPGEEHPMSGAISCMICIFKSVRVLSVYGASVTVINGGDTSISGVSVAVALKGDGAVLGATDHGFTIKGGGFTGVEVVHGSYNKVVGNVVENGIQGSACNGPIYISGNVVSHSAGVGYQVIAEDNCSNAGPIYLTNNIASDNNGPGFVLASIDIIRFVGNVSIRNVIGARIITVNPIGSVSGVISGSAFIANRDAGIVFAEGGARVTGNTILGNQGPGVSVSVTNPRSIILHDNNIYGNDISGVPANCGILNASPVVVDATNNFWGSAAGPGSDPADRAGPGSGCDAGHSSTVVTPFATTRFPVAP